MSTLEKKRIELERDSDGLTRLYARRGFRREADALFLKAELFRRQTARIDLTVAQHGEEVVCDVYAVIPIILSSRTMTPEQIAELRFVLSEKGTSAADAGRSHSRSAYLLEGVASGSRSLK